MQSLPPPVVVAPAVCVLLVQRAARPPSLLPWTGVCVLGPAFPFCLLREIGSRRSFLGFSCCSRRTARAFPSSLLCLLELEWLGVAGFLGEGFSTAALNQMN